MSKSEKIPYLLTLIKHTVGGSLNLLLLLNWSKTRLVWRDPLLSGMMQ